MTEFLSTADGRVGLLAARQHGVVTVAQVYHAGIDKDGVAWRVRVGRLHRLHRGVYAVGHRGLSWRGRWLAAVLAVGDGAVLSHSSAAALWQFLRPIPGPVHVTVPASRRPEPRRGLVVHRARALSGLDGAGDRAHALDGAESVGDRQGVHGWPDGVSDRPRARGRDGGDRGRSSAAARAIVTVRHGIAVTTPARTIEDIRGEVELRLFRRALRQAELAGNRVPHLSTTKRTRSDLELLFLRLCEAHGLPRPEVNVRIGARVVDFLFREEKVAVETDSWDYHRGSVAFEDDHERELALHALGLAVRRYTGDQLEAAPEAVAADLRRALSLD